MKRSARRVLLAAGVILCAVLVLKGSSLLVPSGNWAPEGTMATARLGASAALLGDGRILITGGDAGTGAVTTADFFNADGTISAAPAMTNARSGHISVTLKDGRVLVAGGVTAGGGTTSTVEIFDPITNSWMTAGLGMVEARSGATAALLPDGRVLVAGGQNGSTISSTIEVFDPALGAFTSAGMMSSPRMQHAMTAMQDGRVLIAGGFNGSIPVVSTDIFDSVTGMVSAGPNLSVARFGHSATTLLNGQVVIIGGNNGNADPAQMDTTPAEMVDFTAATPAFTTLATNLATPREGHLAILLPNNNNILIVGGTSTGTPIASAEMFTLQESSQGIWTYGFASTGGLTSARSGVAGSANQLNVPSSTMQRNGVVMVAGGSDANGNALNTTEAYGYPTVQTDQSDYPPGTTVTITGRGFQPNETIAIQLVESPLVDTHGPYMVQADANGNFVDTSFMTDVHDEDIRFYLSATGGTSGFVAQNTFTDASPVLSVTVIGPSGSGSVSSADVQITNCTAATSPGHTCTHTYGANFSTTLTETPNSGTTFIGWSGSGGCTGTSTTCAASATGNNTFSATATFAANQAPTITSANSTTFTAGTAGSFTVTASGVPVPTFTETGTLPSGVTLSSAGLLSGTATVAGSFPITITASNGVLPNATQNFTLTVNPGAVSSGTSTVSANPTSVVADGSTSSTITVTLKDANNNPVSGKTVTLSAGSGSSTISAASGASSASGVVTLTVKDTKAETVTYTAKDTTDNITITQTASVTFTPGSVSATKSTVTANPTSVTADGSTTSTITVTLLDANNNPVSGKTVTLSQGTGSSTISAASGASSASGVVTFTVKDTKAEGVSYTATDSTDSTTITPTASVTFTAGTVNATKSMATANPTSVTADGSTTSTITVTLLDANNNPVSGKTVTLLQGTGSSTISAASGASNASGVVTFTVKDTKAETVTYAAKNTTDNITITQTAAVTFTPGAAAKLAFGQQPTNTAAGSSITPAVTVQVQDANGNVVTSGTGSTASIAVAIGTNPSAGTLSGTSTQTAVNGVTTFSNLSINKTGTGYTLAASSSGLTAGTSNTFNITPGTATQLVFGTQPSNTAAGSAITPAVTVQVEDANNNVVTTSTTAVAIAIGTNPAGGTLSGTTNVNAVNGIATFSNLSINKTGTGYALAASSTGLAGMASNAFNITPGTASKLAFSQQPTNTQAGSSITPAITVQVEDANGNLVTTSTGSIAVAIGTNPGGGSLGGTLTQSAVNGVATFANLSINKTGTGYTLAAGSTGLAGTTSNAFNITAGAASKLAFNVQPSTAAAGQAISPAVTVQVQDANGNVVTTDASNISITISSPGAFSGSSTATVSASSGVATFSNLVPTVTGTFTLSASDGSLTSATSNSFTVNAGALAKFVIANISSPQTAGVAFNVTVTAQDANGNTVTSYNSDGNKANLTSTGALVGSPITTASFTNGVVVQSVTITNTGSFTITATGTGQGNGIGGVPSNLFTVNAGPAASLTISAPASAAAGTAFNFTVTAKDSFGNVATGYAGTVKFSSTDAQAVLPPNSALTNGTGTFSATLKTAGVSTITGTDTVNGSIAGISGNIAVSAGSATALVVTAPASATAGTAFNFTVTAKDSFGNVATGYAGAVKFSSTDAQALLPANSALTNGSAALSATLKTAGNQIITAADTVTSSVTGSSGNITVSAGSAAAITAFSGSGQSTSVGMAFANPLIALVQDGFGNPVSGVTVTFTAPSSGPGGIFNNSTTNVVAATDANGHAGTTFTANTVAGVYAVTASISAVATSANFSLANLAGAITHLALTPATATITAGGNEVYLAEGLDTYNNPAGDVTSATIFTIAPDGSCGTPNPGNSTCTATVADMSGSSHTVTGTYMNSATGSASLTVNAASPTQLVITSNALAIVAGQCSGNITVTSQDQYGNASNTSNATQVNLSSASGTGKFYSDSTCQTQIPASNGKISVSIAANSSSQTFAYEDTTPSPLPNSTTMITAADDATVLTSGTQEETILQLVFTTSSFTVTQNTCSAQITLTAKNAKGTATNVTVAATLGLTSTSNGATFYSDNACAMAITPTSTPLASDVTLGSGASAVNFSYEDGAAGNPTITATIGGYSVAQQEQIGTPPSVTSNPSGQAVTYGSNGMFSVAANGTPTPTVQWQVSSDGTNWNNVGDGGVYSGATTTTLTLTVPPVSLSGTQYRAVFTNAVGSANSNAASLTVNPEPLTVSIIGNPTRTYDATTAATLTSANFSIAGLVGTDKFTVTQAAGMYATANAGSGITVTASLSAGNFTPYGSAVANNYSFPTSASGTGTINRANATITVSPYNVTYDGNPHTATGTAKGVNGEDLSSELDLTHTTHTNAGNYSTDYWTFTDTTGNYNNVTATTITDCIKKANVTVMFSNIGPFTYTGSAQAPTYAVNGVNSEVLTSSATVSYSGTQFNNAAYSSASAPVNGGNYTQSVAFGGSTNYNALSQPATQAFTINRANAMIAVTPYNVTYDGNPHTATGAAKGVNGEDLSSELDLTHTAHTDAGNYSSDYWTFTDGAGNYNNVAATTIADSIAKASSMTTVTFENGPYVYRGTAFTASAQVVGAGGLATSVAITYSGDCANVTVANGCTATATYAGDPDHFGSSDTKSVTITQAPSTTLVNCPASVTYNGLAQSPCTATAVGASLSVVLPISYSNNLNAGNATATATYGGDENHTSSSSSVNFTINPATTSVSVVSSLNPSNWGNVVTLTATVANTSTTAAPTGSVSFYNAASGANCSSLGASTLLDTAQLSTIGANQQASTSTPNLPVGPGNTVGTDAVLACYNYNPADPNFNADFVASNGTMTQTVNPAPIATLVPSSLSFGGQQGGTVSGAQTVTICNGPSGISGAPCFNAPASTAALVITSIGFTSPNTNPVYFNQTSTCPIGGVGLAIGDSCASNVRFAPPLNAQGIATALLTVTDNNENVAGSAQSASLVGAGTSAVTGVGSLSTYAIFGTANGCSSVNVSGNGTVDSFGNNNSSGNVGANGNVTLSGNPVVNGAVYSPIGGTGNCSTKTMTGLSTSGKAQATGGLQMLSGALTYPLPPAPNPAPPTTTQNISGSCGSISGCINNGSKNVILAPGQYGNLSISGGTTVNVSGGNYNINSLTLSGNSTLVVSSNASPVVVNLAGKSLSGGNAVLDFSGGSMSNSSGMASNLQLYYAGSQPMKLSGGAGSYAVVYAPNAPINISGGSHFYGSIIGSTVNSSGNTAIHYPTSLASISSGNSIWFSSTGLTVKGLPNTGSVKLYVTNASINFMASGTTYNLPVPNAVITFSSTATSASTTWDATNNRWSTLIPMSSVNANAAIHTFFDGIAFQVPSNGFPTGIQNVTWQAAYSTSTTGLSFNWQWGAAVYSTLPAAGATGNYSSFGVNSLDNSVPAGTPVNYEGNLVFGDTGAGYTGLYANFVGVVPTIAPMNIAPNSYDFGGVSQGSTATANMPFVLTNNDSVPYTISSIQMTGTYAGDFIQTNNCPISPNTLGAGASCTLTVNFTPSTSGGTKETAKIVINDNANNSPQTVFLKGTGQ